MAHEWTHGVIEGTSSGLGFEGEAGALNESFADIFGKIVEYRESTSWTNNNVVHPANPEVEFSWIMAQQGGGQIARSLSNPHDGSPKQPKEYQGTFWCTSGCSAHQNSGVQNHWFYLLSEGKDGNVDLPGIGIEKASKIAFRNMTNYIQNGSTYADSRIGSWSSATEIFGRCSDEEFQTRLAWKEVNVNGYDDWCSYVKGPRVACIDDDPQTIFLTTYQLLAPGNAEVTWFFDPRIEFSLIGEDERILRITNWGDAEPGDCFWIVAEVVLNGQTKHSWFKVCLEDCSYDEMQDNPNNKIMTFENLGGIGKVEMNTQPKVLSNSRNEAKFETFPNPSDGSLFITTDYESNCKIIILNSLNRVVHEENINSGFNSLALKDKLSSGLYLIVVEDESRNIIFKQLITVIN